MLELAELVNALPSTKIALIIWHSVVVGIWAFLSFKTGRLVEIPDSVIIILSALITGRLVKGFDIKRYTNKHKQGQ